MLALQIAIGIWLGGLFLIGTGAAWQKIEQNKRYGAPWWRGFLGSI